ncbi:MAG TPA: threonine/serine dehydratase [Gemmatimonadales bacterium]|nr:threonine/serine dehydratase [Gemmatimonadales bacterium]
MVTARDIQDAAEGLRGIARRTRLVYVEQLGVHLKLENEQPIGAFKIRGAYNAVRKLSDAARQRGVITYSSGNHGQAVAFAAKQFGIRAVVTMPETAPRVKVDGVKKWGGEVVIAGRTSDDRRIKAEEIAQREGLAVVPPFDHPDIVAGQATIALEIVEQLPDVERVVVPVGGGGLISGIVAGLAAVNSKAAVWGVEPIGAPKLQRSLAAGKVVRLDSTRSIADGLITLNVGDVPFAELARERERIRGVVLVEDESIRAAVQFLWRTAQLAVEPSGAATTAALLAGLVPRARTTVLVVSGGNVDPALLEAAD